MAKRGSKGGKRGGGRVKRARKPKPTPARKNKRGGAALAARRNRRRRTAAPRSSDIGRELRETERGIERMERPRGRAKIATRKVTPTKRGFKALEETERKLARELARMEKQGKRPTLTFDATITFKGKKPRELEGIGLRRLKDIRTKKGETRTEAIQRAIDRKIRSTVFDAIKEEFPDTDSPQLKSGLRRWARKKVQSALRAFKRRRGAGFSITFNRET